LRSNGVDSNEFTSSELNTDMKLTKQQRYCWYNQQPDEKFQKHLWAKYVAHNCTVSGTRSAFDKSVQTWKYQNGFNQKWMIPMMIRGSTYPKRYQKKAWENFL